MTPIEKKKHHVPSRSESEPIRAGLDFAWIQSIQFRPKGALCCFFSLIDNHPLLILPITSQRFPPDRLSLSCRCITLGSRTELNPSSARPAYRLYLAAATPARIITTTQPDYSSCPIPHKATSLVTTPILLSTRYTHA